MRADTLILWLAVVVPCGLLFAAPAVSSDDDERPAYMIYIDPVTGKYTTEDPSRSADQESLETADPDANDERSMVPQIIGGMLLLMVLIGYAARTWRMDT